MRRCSQRATLVQGEFLRRPKLPEGKSDAAKREREKDSDGHVNSRDQQPIKPPRNIGAASGVRPAEPSGLLGRGKEGASLAAGHRGLRPPEHAVLGPGAYSHVQAFTGSLIGKLIVFGYTWALLHHLMSGIRYFFWDLGYGFKPNEREALTWGALIAGISLTVLVWIIAYAIGGSR